MQRHGPAQCPLCQGQECHGGGNLQCVQRDPQPSRIGGILDCYGGFRVVVEHADAFHHHVRAGEYLFLVPDAIAHEPIAWGDIPLACHCARQALVDWISLNGLGNDPGKREALLRWQLRQKEHPDNKGSVRLPDIVYT